MQPKAANDQTRCMIAHSAISEETLPAAEEHLGRACAVMARLIATHGRCEIVGRNTSPFQTLAGSIMSQQLSAKAAATIKHRVLDIVPNFDPVGFLTASPDLLRAAGLSIAKARYICELANRVNDGRINFDTFAKQSDDEVISTLIELPGVGRWTAEMFLIFGLRRANVLALGDAGLQRAARLLYGVNVDLQTVGLTWQPYSSVASWYLWRHLDTAPA